jgi:hypothetical protein
MKIHSRFTLGCALLAIVAGTVSVSRAHADMYELLASNSSAQNGGQDNNAPSTPGVPSHSSEPESQPRTAVVLRFAVESQPVTDAPALSAQACPQTSAATSPATATPSTSFTVDTKTPSILDTISREMQKKLSKKMSVMVDPDPAAIPVGALVISGCITKENGGNAATRLIGMNVGASHLGVHVVALSKTRDGWSPIDTFDIQVKGGNILPPVGAAGFAVNAARDLHENLKSDGTKLADHILKKLTKDMKASEQQQKNI